MKRISPQALKAQVRKAALKAYSDMLVEDPLDITDHHFRILLKDMSPGEIIYATSKVLGKESEIVNVLIGRFNKYLKKCAPMTTA